MMKDDTVRRVFIDDGCADWHHTSYGTHIWSIHSRGCHALMPWKYHEEREAEIERLRKALEEIAGLTDELYSGPNTHKGMKTVANCAAANTIARRALGGE